MQPPQTSSNLLELISSSFQSGLKHYTTEDRIEWFSDLLRRRPDESASSWSIRILESWVPLFSGLQASLYWVVQGDAQIYLQLLSSYACDTQQLRPTVELGEGLIGQSARSNRLIYLDDRSRFKPVATTNLSAIQPAAYLVAPLVYNQVVEGVIEMTLINRLAEEDLAQLRRMGNQLGASLRALRNEEVTRKLYAQMQQKNEELTAQDEEMRQNLEEMQATQAELRRTKEEVERRQHQFELIAGNIPGALLQLHEFPAKDEKIVRYASRRLLDLFGLEPEKLIGTNFMTQLEVYSDDEQVFLEADQNSFSGGEFSMQLRVRTPAMPDFRWFQFKGFVADQKDGSFLSDIYIEDIHEAKLQERELKIKTEVFTSSNDSIWILDGPKIIDCNEASSVLFGTGSREEVIDTTPFKWSPELQPCGTPSDELAAVRIHKAMTDGFNEFEWVHKRQNGELFDCEVRLNRIIIGDKVLLSAFHRDISFRKELERANQAELERLRKIESEKREREVASIQHQYQHFLDQLDQAVFIITSSGSPYFANRRALELLGKGLDPQASQDELAKVHPAYKLGTDTYYPTEELPVVRALAGEDSTIDDMEIETPLGRKRIKVHGFPIRDDSGTITYAMCTFDLITD